MSEADRGARRGRRGRGRRWRPRQKRSGSVPAAGDDIHDAPAPASSPASAPTISMLADEMIRRFTLGQYSCAICIENIGARAAIFACASCYACVHLECALRWGRSQQAQDAPASNAKTLKRWRCPNCQFVITAKKDLPTFYKCFCGKMKDPSFDPDLTPHSCGSVCGRPRSVAGCVHTCTLLCHPGPCPECTAVVSVQCACKRSRIDIRCSRRTDSKPTCSAVCRRLLQCKKHTCKLMCHNGPCGPCNLKNDLTCFCGRSKATMNCGEGVLDKISGTLHFTCGTACGKQLACGNHSCTLLCHSGPCPSCDRAVTDPQTCACGKLFPPDAPRRVSCLDPIPTCDQTCGRRLPGCEHVCTNPCHDSPCPPCSEMVTTLCFCGREVRVLPCPEYRHALEEDGTPKLRCASVCNAPLGCGRHRCTKRCCDLVSHTCTVPCGKTLNCGIHACEQNCHSQPCPPCGRPIVEGVSCPCGARRIPGPVLCGTDPPECTNPCRVTRPCGHRCVYNCHVGPCPKCMILVKRLCAGGHKTMPSVPCSAAAVSCGHPCGQPMPCRRHICTKPCHVHERDSPCTEKCGSVRPCSHPCAASCHGDDNCPSVPCKKCIRVQCACGRLVAEKQCGYTSGFPDAQQLPCDTVCLQTQRNRALAAALDVPIGASAEPVKIPWTVHILTLANNDLVFVQRAERQLDSFLSSSNRTLFMDATTLNRVQLLRHMAQAYGLVSEVFNDGKGRCVRFVRQDSSRALHSRALLSSCAQLYARGPSSTRPKVAQAPSTHAVVQINGLVEGGNILLDRLVASWRHSDHVQVRWLDRTAVVIAFASTDALQSALCNVDESGLVYSEVVAPSQSFVDQMQASAAASKGSKPNAGKPSLRLQQPQRASNIWDSLRNDNVPDQWDA
ncbi:NF-X1-type domain-containing protein [Plasmodiophora brassicae]